MTTKDYNDMKTRLGEMQDEDIRHIYFFAKDPGCTLPPNPRRDDRREDYINKILEWRDGHPLRWTRVCQMVDVETDEPIKNRLLVESNERAGRAQWRANAALVIAIVAAVVAIVMPLIIRTTQR